MFSRPFLLLSALVLAAPAVFPVGVSAQGGTVAPLPIPAPRSASYKLGPGDVISVTVAGFPELSQASLPVPPDGLISLPRLNTFQLNGRTVLSVQNEIRQRLISRVRLRNPQVAVQLVSARSGVVGSVSVNGDVPRSGSFPVREGQRLSDLLAEAGLNERLEERRATLARGGTRQSLDLKSAATRPGSVADVLLRAGDSIAVRAIAPGKINLQGDVAQPGEYELHANPRADAREVGLAPRLSDLITRAGGLRTPDDTPGSGSAAPGSATQSSAGGAEETGAGATGENPFGSAPRIPAPSAVRLPPSQNTPRLPTTYTATLQRGGKPRALDVDAALNDVFGTENIFLKAGDFVTVRLVRPITVYVDGAVSKIGSYQLAPGAGVLELLTLAGPITRSPNDLRAAIRRRNGNETIPLDLPALLQSSESGANVQLQNGDIVQLREPETLGVLVAGQVTRPGQVKVRPGATIFEALSAAGGVAGGTSIESARLNVLRRERDGSQRVYPANAAGILTFSDIRTNLVLHEGDIVNLTRGEDQSAFVSGEVVNPGSFTLLPGEGLAQLITRAGGPKDTAALTRVRVTRKGEVQVVDALDAVKNGRPLAFALQSGDIVNVPLNTDRVLAQEAFAKPGYYSIPERGQLTLLDFLAQAAPNPGVKKLFILQANADGSIDPKKAPTRTVFLEELRSGRQPNFALAPRQVIFAVPPKNTRNIFELLGPLGLLSTLF